MIIGTAGHIDHGKTALVKALTGIDADRLPEEKRRGITIDLGYAYTDAFGFVDVPGHERFVHTMLAGASGVDAALLVVALNDGVMPQTREHVQILQLLGIDRGVVALTKSDLAPARDAEVAAQVNALLQKTALASAPLLPVSVVTGAGIEALRSALLSLGPRQRDAELYPRLAVDRAFTLTGAGLVVTGTLVSGRIRVDDRLMLSPPGIELRVRGLHAQNRPAEQAVAGQRAALNVTGPRLSKDVVNRGDWVLHPAVHAPTARFDVRVTLLAEELRGLRADAAVHLHLGAAHVTARVAALDGGRIEPGSTVLARLTLDRPIGALARDRLVLRDAMATCTIGGGVVIDPFPPRRGRRAPERLPATHGVGLSLIRATHCARCWRWRPVGPIAPVRPFAQPVARGAAVGRSRLCRRSPWPYLLMTPASSMRCRGWRDATAWPRTTLRRPISRACSSNGCEWQHPAGHQWRRSVLSSSYCSAAVRWNRTVRGFGWPRIAPFCRHTMKRVWQAGAVN